MSQMWKRILLLLEFGFCMAISMGFIMRDDRKVDISLHSSELYQVSIGGREIMNPIAVAMVVLGTLLLGWGLLMLAKHKKAIGFTLSFLGSVIAVTPFVISFLLFR